MSLEVLEGWNPQKYFWDLGMKSLYSCFSSLASDIKHERAQGNKRQFSLAERIKMADQPEMSRTAKKAFPIRWRA